MSDSKGAPIFVVGAPRSGTTLLAAILSTHPEWACGPETQFFPKIGPRGFEQALSDRNWPEEAVRCLMGLTLSGQSVVDLYGLTEREIGAYLQTRNPSIQAMLESLTEQFASRQGKLYWMEKTPNHILNLPGIRKLYPKARIVRIMRDPRDSALSMCQLPWTSQRYVANCYLWSEWYSESEKFLESDGGCVTIRYEDLVNQPEAILRSLCEFLHIEFVPEMLAHEKAPDTVTTNNEPWKDSVRSALSSRSIGRWKNELSGDERVFASMLFAPQLREFRYPEPSEAALVLSIPSTDRTFAERAEKELVESARKGIVFVGKRDTGRWLGAIWAENVSISMKRKILLYAIRSRAKCLTRKLRQFLKLS